MVYKPFQEWNISTLGMGNMRLPTVGERGPVDEGKARALIEYAYGQGVNYFDTAYRYHGGESEKVVGRALKQFPRETWHLATKMPGHMMNNKGGKLGFQGYLSNFHVDSVADIFEEQLEKCGVDYFDFYLLHNVCETSFDFYTDENLGVVEYLRGQKEKGRIRHLGFSAHGRAETIEKFLDWNGGFEFAQIQLNYLDWALQEAGKKYELLAARGIPVVVMEPCRGGGLADLPPAAAKMLKEARPEASLASWAFRFLQALPGVQVVLSGMSTMEQLKENVALFNAPEPATEAERALLKKVADSLAERVPCTACRYCCEECPRGLDIPKLIALYNEMKLDGYGLLSFNMNAMGEGELPAACLGCGACQKLCPQGIRIPEIMREFADMLREAKG